MAHRRRRCSLKRHSSAIGSTEPDNVTSPRALRRRSQTSKLTWEKMKRLIATWLPPARLRHPLPDVRFRVMTQGKSPVR
jgi:hypothetical protein